MSRPAERVYSRYTTEALTLFGRLIRISRRRRRMSAQELARRAGISRGLLQRIEKGDPRCEIGVAFELAALLELPLFHADREQLQSRNRLADEMIALLPQPRAGKLQEVDDDF